MTLFTFVLVKKFQIVLKLIMTLQYELDPSKMLELHKHIFHIEIEI